MSHTLCAFCRSRIRGDFTEVVYQTPIQVYHLHPECTDAFVAAHRLLGTKLRQVTQFDGYLSVLEWTS